MQCRTVDLSDLFTYPGELASDTESGARGWKVKNSRVKDLWLTNRKRLDGVKGAMQHLTHVCVLFEALLQENMLLSLDEKLLDTQVAHKFPAASVSVSYFGQLLSLIESFTRWI